MYLKDSKTVVIKIGSSLLINDKKIVREKWLKEFAKDIEHLKKLKKKQKKMYYYYLHLEKTH